MGVVAMNLAPTLRIGDAVGRQGEPATDDQGEPFPERGREFSSTFAVLRVLLVLQRFNGVSTSLRSRLAPTVLLIRA